MKSSSSSESSSSSSNYNKDPPGAAPDPVPAAVREVGEGVAPARRLAFEVASLLKDTCRLVALLRALLSISLVFSLVFPFLFPLTFSHFSRHQLQMYFSQKQKQSNPVVGSIPNEPVLYVPVPMRYMCR